MLFWLRILRFRDIIGVLGGSRILSQILTTDRTKSEMVMRGQWRLSRNSDSADRHKRTGGGTLDKGHRQHPSSSEMQSETNQKMPAIKDPILPSDVSPWKCLSS